MTETQNFIIEYLKNNQYNLIDVSKDDVGILCNKMEKLYEENNEKNILYYLSKNTSSIFKKYMEIGFKIPTAYNLIVIFYKGDYFYTDENAKELEPLNEILRIANKKIYTKCKVCKEIRQHLICCYKCDNQFCKKCIKEGLKECNKCGEKLVEG
jgi:hypothetical protein